MLPAASSGTAAWDKYFKIQLKTPEKYTGKKEREFPLHLLAHYIVICVGGEWGTRGGGRPASMA